MGLINVSEAARRLGINRKTLTQYLQSGDIEGKRIGTRWYVDEATLARAGASSPTAYLKEGGGDGGNTPNDKGKGDTATVILSEEAQTTRMKLNDRKAIAESEKDAIEAEIARDEAQKVREKPDKLKEREESLNEREQRLNDREGEIESQLQVISKRMEVVRVTEENLKERERVAEADYTEKVRNTEDYLNDLGEQIQSLNNQIKVKQETLESLAVAETREIGVLEGKADEIEENLALWLKHTSKHAGYYTRLGDGKSGIGDRYTEVGAALWDMHDDFQRLKVWVQMVEETSDMSPQEMQDEYDRRIEPMMARVDKIIGRGRIIERSNNNRGHFR